MSANYVITRIAELSDTNIVSPADGQVLSFDAASGKFTPKAPTGSQGPAGATGPAGGGAGVDVTTLTPPVVAGQDFTAVLQADFNARTGAVNYYFPANPVPYRYSRPVYIDRDYCGVTGAGRGLTTLCPSNGNCDPFFFGLRQVETPSGTPQSVTSANRPDCFGVLDASIAPSPAAWLGYRTLGKSYVMAVDNPATYGVISSHGSRVYDNYGEFTALTIQVALKFVNGTADLGAGSNSILGLGGSGVPGPYWLGTDAAGLWYFASRTADGVVRSFRAAPNSTAAGLHRLRVYVNFTTGAYGFAQNGAAITPSNDSSMAGLAGHSPMRHRGDYPCWIGPSTGVTQGLTNQAVPDYTILAASVRNVAVTAEPANDAARYDVPNGDTTGVWGLDGTFSVLNRTLRLKCSNALTAKPEAFATVIPTGGTDGGVKGNFVRDMTIDGGGVTLGQVLDFSMTRVKAYNGFVGLHNLPFQVIYPVVVTDCQLGGYSFGVRLTGATPVRLHNVDFVGNGQVAAALYVGCDVVHDGCEGEFFVPSNQEAWMIFASDQFGMTVSLSNMYADSEAGWCTRAFLLCEKSDPGPLTTFRVSNVGAAIVGPGAYLIELADKVGATGANKGQANISGLNVKDLTSAGVLKASASWYLTADLRGNPDQRTTIAAPSQATVLT